MHSLTMRRRLSIAAAMALSAGALAVPAGAAQLFDPDAPTIGYGSNTSLTIHKCEQTDTNGVTEGTGNEDPTAECKPVSDVEFTITKLNVDLTTNAGWKTLAETKGDVSKARALTGGPAHTVTTGGDGLAYFGADKTEVGAYLVSETRTPAQVIPAEDFVVTLPMTNPQDTTKWNYNVHVYPKNTVAGVDKKVEDKKAAGSGQNITYSITTSIPKVDTANGATLKRYQVIDPLDSRVKSDLGSLKPVVKIINPETQLEKDTDYTLTVTASATPGDDHHYLTVTMTPAGLDKVAKARTAGTGETKVQVTLTAAFESGVNLEGALSNVASLIPNDNPNMVWDPEHPTNNVPGVPTKPILSKYGKVKVTKTGTDALADKTKYNGAQFQVYECLKAAGGGILKDADPNKAGTNPLTIGGQDTFTTTGQGVVEISSLRANDYVDGAQKTQLTNNDYYCLVETKAPEGYSLQAEPIPFRVLAADAEAKTPTEVTVTDVPKNAGFRLPLTGANGVIFLTVAGAFLVAGGAVVAYVNKRRNAAKH